MQNTWMDWVLSVFFHDIIFSHVLYNIQKIFKVKVEPVWLWKVKLDIYLGTEGVYDNIRLTFVVFLVSDNLSLASLFFQLSKPNYRHIKLLINSDLPFFMFLWCMLIMSGRIEKRKSRSSRSAKSQTCDFLA